MEHIIVLFVMNSYLSKNSCSSSNLSSKTKFDSGTGWPSFYDAEKKNIEEKSDSSYGMSRTEVLCSNVNFLKF